MCYAGNDDPGPSTSRATARGISESVLTEFLHTYAAAIETRDVVRNRTGIFRRTVNVSGDHVTPQLLMRHVREILRLRPNMQCLSISGGLLLYSNGSVKFFYPSNNSQLFPYTFRISLKKRSLKIMEKTISQFSENEYTDVMSSKNCVDSEASLSLLTVVQFTDYFSPEK